MMCVFFHKWFMIFVFCTSGLWCLWFCVSLIHGHCVFTQVWFTTSVCCTSVIWFLCAASLDHNICLLYSSDSWCLCVVHQWFMISMCFTPMVYDVCVFYTNDSGLWCLCFALMRLVVVVGISVCLQQCFMMHLPVCFTPVWFVIDSISLCVYSS